MANHKTTETVFVGQLAPDLLTALTRYSNLHPVGNFASFPPAADKF